MATKTYTLVPSEDINVLKAIWSGFAASGDVGTPIRIPAFPDRTVQIYGSFGTGGEITLEGSNDPRADPNNASYASSVWFPLTDPQGNSIVKTAAAGEAITELPEWVRPRASAGSGASIDVALYAKGILNG